MGPGMFSGGEGFLVEVLLNLNVEKRDGYDGRKWWHLTGNPGGEFWWEKTHGDLIFHIPYLPTASRISTATPLNPFF